MHYTTGKAFLVIIAAVALLYYTFAKRAYKGPYLGSYAEVNYRLNKREDAQSQVEEMV